jgi:hypothetical protein
VNSFSRTVLLRPKLYPFISLRLIPQSIFVWLANRKMIPLCRFIKIALNDHSAKAPSLQSLPRFHRKLPAILR